MTPGQFAYRIRKCRKRFAALKRYQKDMSERKEAGYLMKLIWFYEHGDRSDNLYMMLKEAS